MLTESNKIPQFKVIFIDEAQDLSPLQWKLFDKLKEHTEDMYLAGDDDQAIYAWAGADVRRFIEEPAKEKVLKFSKRISETIQSESKIPISRIKGIRKKKEYLPRNYKGKSQYISNLSQVNLLKDKWLILTRTQQTAANIMTELKNKNLYYMFKTDKSYQIKLYKKIKNYLRWYDGEQIEEKEVKDILKLTSEKELVKKQWYKFFDKAPIKEKTYILKLMEQGEDLDADARIRVSTIHSIKGGEEDNVILFMHQGSRIQKSIKRSLEKQDEEHRVWYVAITRARNNLYKLKTKNKLTEYNI
jgi:DNA helicase-2/ATP-dependent DNA helicase PcrA